MSELFNSSTVERHASVVWVNLMTQTSTAQGEAVSGAFVMHPVNDPTQIPGAIQTHAPHFLCFEFDKPDTLGMSALEHTRREYPNLPVLMLTESCWESLALWALHIRIWDVLVKPFSSGQLNQCINTLIDLTHRDRVEPGLSLAARFATKGTEYLSALKLPGRVSKTYPAISLVAAHFDQKIALEDAAAVCQLSPSQFSRVFRQEQGVSFIQYLLHYRIEQASKHFAQSGAPVKEVAYAVGFNDLSYFTWAFKRQLGVCPSSYKASARSS